MKILSAIVFLIFDSIVYSSGLKATGIYIILIATTWAIWK